MTIVTLGCFNNALVERKVTPAIALFPERVLAGSRPIIEGCAIRFPLISQYLGNSNLEPLGDILALTCPKF